MVALRTIFFPFLFLFCILLILINPLLAEGVQLTTSANPSQGGTVLPDCTAGCSYNSGAQVPLIAVASSGAVPNSGYVFDDWSGNCAGTSPLTSVTMTTAEDCVANFSSCPDLPVKIAGTQYPTFDEAYAAAVNGDTIEALSTSLAATLRLDRNISITLDGGNSCGYTSTPSFTIIQGQMIVSTGSVTAENVIIMPVIFSQNDLTGEWDIIAFGTGAKPGWIHELASIDSTGSVTVISYLDSTGNSTPPSPGSTVVSVDSSGTVTAATGNLTFSGSLSSDKTLGVATQTSGGGGTLGLFVLRKRVTGLNYSSADIDNINFAFHDLFSGGDSVWVYGTAQTDASGNVTILTDNDPLGPIIPPPAGGTLFIDSNGIVTATNNTFYGLMTIDKKEIFNIETFNSTPTYRFAAFLLTGQSFVESDLEGIYDFHRLDSGLTPLWARGTFSIDTSGNQVYQSYLDSTNNMTLPASDVLTIDSGGTITKSTSPTFNGQMAYNKDLFVRTQTQGTGTFGLSISVK